MSSRPELAERWLRIVPTLLDTPLRSAFVRNELATHAAAHVGPALEDLLERASSADGVRARELLPTFVLALASPPCAPLRAELSIVARTLPLPHVARLFPLQLEAEPEDSPPIVAKRSDGRTLTLGERKALARRPNRASLEKLLFDPHPAVLSILLANPRLTEDDVLRIAARRPGNPLLLSILAQHDGWMQRPRVRLAIIQNPRTPVDVAVPLVLLLVRPELEQIVVAVDLPEAVRTLADARLRGIPPFHEPALEAGG